MIISLGYRIRSVIATHFRRWATERLKEYIIKGFTMDDERLKGNGGGAYWHELLTFGDWYIAQYVSGGHAGRVSLRGLHEWRLVADRA